MAILITAICFLLLIPDAMPFSEQSASNNPHIREERNIDDSGVNEEDK